MLCLSKMTCWATALLASIAYAQPHGHLHQHLHHQSRSSTCDFGIPDPADCTASILSQWCSMITAEVTGLSTKEDPSIILPTVEQQYSQANIKAAPSSAIASAEDIMQYPLARAAMSKMKSAYPLTGSPDLTESDIAEVYAPALQEACNRSGVPEDVLTYIIFTESKGHPLVYGGLTQMDYVAWGQMVDENTDLKNRYQPWSNIIASAMLMKKLQETYGGSWLDCYHAHYQG